MTCRSEPGAPTLTTLVGLVPAKPPKVVPAMVALLVGLGAAVTELAPSATEPLLPAEAPEPMATASVPVAMLSGPVELAWKYLMPWLLMLLMADPTLLLVVVVPLAL
ncbi:hypothetical protein Bsp3421_001410 [Burkholderia sp. FERM BP-3421]|nr:hypothetical protein Bsp3421_001410 [Burkholderia sp. FERM BP-3421]